MKDKITSLGGKDNVKNVKKDIDEIETINIELEHNQFDSIGKTRVQSKEHCDSLIAQINSKSLENLDLNAQLQEKVFAITTLKNELRKLKGKIVVNTVVSKPNAILAPRMFKLDIEPISARLKNNRNAHEELLVCASQTCLNSPKPSEKLVDVTPSNKDKRVRFAEPVTSSNNIPKHIDSLKTKDSNKPLLTSTGVKPTTSASGSKPSGNTKNNRISRPPRCPDCPLVSRLRCSKHMTGNRSQLMNFVSKFLGTVQFRNDQIAKINRSKDEAPDASIKCIKNIQVRLNATVRNVRTDNGTEFFNQTLRNFYENVGISPQTSVARTPQQNSVVKRRNQTLVEASRTMLIFSKAPLFLWAEAINTACYTKNCSLIHL
ncbi:retrovirus-related pol polyprotein from transposon TNT 1-94 [Tanacetum coccineum]